MIDDLLVLWVTISTPKTQLTEIGGIWIGKQPTDMLLPHWLNAMLVPDLFSVFELWELEQETGNEKRK